MLRAGAGAARDDPGRRPEAVAAAVRAAIAMRAQLGEHAPEERVGDAAAARRSESSMVEPLTETGPTAIIGGVTPISRDAEPVPVTEPFTTTLIVNVPRVLYVWLGP